MKNLFLFISALAVSIAFTSCTKDSVDPTNSVASNSENTSTTGNGRPSTGTSSSTTLPTIDDADLQGNWTVVSDSSFWAGELPLKVTAAYTGKSGDFFNFSKNGNLYMHEDSISDTTAYSVDATYKITVTYADATHFNEAPGFGFGISIAGSNPPVNAYFTQQYINANTLILVCSNVTPDGVGSRVIYLKR